jgi:hypothetical protein
VAGRSTANEDERRVSRGPAGGCSLPECVQGGRRFTHPRATSRGRSRSSPCSPLRNPPPAGEVTFEVENARPADPHEFVVIRTNLAPEALPTDEDGAVDEEGEGIEVLGEIEEFPPCETQERTFDLDAGSYVFICNPVEEGGRPRPTTSSGLRTAFTVD